MRYSKLFGKTTKTTPSDEKVVSNKLLHQAGFIRESTAGRYFFLPLGMSVFLNVMKIVKEEMDLAGGQEMISPVLHPLELWKETNRTNTAGFELMKIKDRRKAEFALGGTAEEMFVDVVRKFQISYKDLPFNIYQFSTKFRDELRARGGLLRVREFVMKDAYSFHTDEKDFTKEYEKMAQTYKRIYERLGLKTVKVEADNGYIGGDYCHEFVVESPIGESKFLMTPDGTYAAHEDVARFTKDRKNLNGKLEALVEVDANRGTTMEDGVKLHKKPLWQQIKDVLFVDEKGRFILAIIRGDYEVNEMKLRHLTGAIELRHATEEEIREKIKSEPGFLSPVKIKEGLEEIELIIVADDSLRTIVNAYGGANKKHKDLFNMNIDRDYKADIEGDIAMAKDGYQAPDGKQKLVERRGIEVGNIFQLGYHYSSLMKGATFTDKEGKSLPFYMGCYGIGIGRTLAAIAEIHNNDKGLTWPESVSPFRVHLVGLDLQDEAVSKKCNDLYQKLNTEYRIPVLYDDRVETRAGEKFADADLIGIPHRLVISKKSGDKIEYKARTGKETELLTIEELLKKLQTK